MRQLFKKICVIALFTLILSACEKPQEEEYVKKDFLITTKLFNEFEGKSEIKKSGRIDSKQDITIAANAVGSVKNIYVKQGDFVMPGEILAVLKDDIANYTLNLERAKNTLSRAQINYDSNKINLDKQVFDSEINLKKLRNNLDALIKGSKEDIRQAETNLNNSDYTNIDSTSALELQKIDNSITKSKLDYENVQIANNERLEGYYSTLEREHNALLTLLDDIIEFSDQLLGVSQENRQKNDGFEMYLGAQDTNQKSISSDYLRALIVYKDNEFEKISINSVSTPEELSDIISKLDEGYSKSKQMLNALEKTLNNSISSISTFTQSTINGYISQINIYQTTLQGNLSGFIAFESGVNSFLRTYKNDEESILKSIELLEKDKEILKKSLSVGGESAEVGYNKTIINSTDAIESLNLQIQTAENTYTNAQKTREVTLRSLQNTIDDANISYKQSLKEYQKLTITSPIKGVVNNVMVDVGQEVGNSSIVFALSNDTNNEISIYFNKKELDFIYEGKTVKVQYDNNTYDGSINSIAKTADSNLKYLAKVSLDSGNNIIGNIVTVFVPIEIQNTLLPVNIIKIKSDGLGTINTYKDGEIKQLDIKLGNIYVDYIEVLSELPGDTQVILSNVGNFDPEKFILKLN